MTENLLVCEVKSLERDNGFLLVLLSPFATVTALDRPGQVIALPTLGDDKRLRLSRRVPSDYLKLFCCECAADKVKPTLFNIWIVSQDNLSF